MAEPAGRGARWEAAVVLPVVGVLGCAAQGDEAARQSAVIVQRLNQGECREPPERVDTAAWNALCTAVRAALADGGAVTLTSTTTRSSGEIGYTYQSVATLAGREDATLTLWLYFRGTGTSGARPELSYVTLDGEVVFDRSRAVQAPSGAPMSGQGSQKSR